MTHAHEWRMVAHVDGCHAYTTTARCECGATMHATAERDLKADPYSAVWMMDDTEADEPCARCHELLAGATPKAFQREVVEPR